MTYWFETGFMVDGLMTAPNNCGAQVAALAVVSLLEETAAAAA
jgi:hypothetical protein